MWVLLLVDVGVDSRERWAERGNCSQQTAVEFDVASPGPVGQLRPIGGAWPAMVECHHLGEEQHQRMEAVSAELI